MPLSGSWSSPVKCGTRPGQSARKCSERIVAAASSAGITECMSTGVAADPLDLAAVNRRGRTIVCHIACSPLHGPGDGVVLLIEEVRGKNSEAAGDGEAIFDGADVDSLLEAADRSMYQMKRSRSSARAADRELTHKHVF